MGRCDGPRGVPFSAKQKKGQLQKKREKKSGAPVFGIREHDGRIELNNTEGDTGKARNGLRSLFERESKEEIDRRRLAAQEPMEGRCFSLGVAFQRWWDASGEKEPTPPRSVPLLKRPDWCASDTKEEVDERERREFLRWQLRIDAALGRKVNLFERNLEVWRQLWRVVEMSHVVYIVADARHPFLHLPPSIFTFLKAAGKPTAVVLNKIDLVPRNTVDSWKYFLNQAYPTIPILEFSCRPNPDTVTCCMCFEVSILVEQGNPRCSSLRHHPRGVQETMRESPEVGR
eukprot:Hpha_TRINITY_DN15494_c2_g3::TRINITY_DN15494_c2_g3_i1::g.177196::m.177196